MKKILIAAAMTFISLGMSAQIIRSTTSERTLSVEEPVVNNSWNHSGFFVNAGLGFYTGDDVDSDCAFSAGLGYRLHISSGFSWEILKIGINTGFSNFTDMMYLRFTTGIRYDSERLGFLGNRPIYGAFNLGYGGTTEEFEGGFCYEIGAGVKLTRNVSLGLFYEGDKESYDMGRYGTVDANWGVFGLKIEYLF